MTTLLWLRRDLRLSDNPALNAAISDGGAVVPIFIFDDFEEHEWSLGQASRWWLHRSLEKLSGDIQKRKNKLIIRSGHAYSIIKELLNETGAMRVFWNRCYEPEAIQRDKDIKRSLIKERAGCSKFQF